MSSSEAYRLSLLVDAHDLAPCPDCAGTDATHWPDCPWMSDEYTQADYDELQADIARDERGA